MNFKIKTKTNIKLLILLTVAVIAILLLLHFKPFTSIYKYPALQDMDEQPSEDSLITIIPEDSDLLTAEDEPIVGYIQPGQGLAASLLAIEEIENKHVIDIISALDNNINFKLLQPEDEFLIRFCGDKEYVMEFVYKSSPVLHHVVKRESIDEPLVYEEVNLPTEKRLSIVEGTIDTTLNQALIDLNISTDIINSANNVLSSTVSFRTHARVGDQFKLFLEEEFYEDLRVGGTLLYASYRGSRAGFHEAFYFRGDDSRSAYNNHYTRDGKILASSAFRLPLNRIYITSSYGYRRHPITNRRTFHYGVDYRGRTGTPVYAIANGVVHRSYYDRNAGNVVIIRHNNGYESHYYHLHRRLVKAGQRIVGRQQIGTVGSTGRSTGPHLHLGLKHNNRWVNPQNMRMIATAKLEGDKFKQFGFQIAEIESLLSEKEKQMNPPSYLAALLSMIKASIVL